MGEAQSTMAISVVRPGNPGENSSSTVGITEPMAKRQRLVPTPQDVEKKQPVVCSLHLSFASMHLSKTSTTFQQNLLLFSFEQYMTQQMDGWTHYVNFRLRQCSEVQEKYLDYYSRGLLLLSQPKLAQTSVDNPQETSNIYGLMAKLQTSISSDLKEKCRKQTNIINALLKTQRILVDKYSALMGEAVKTIHAVNGVEDKALADELTYQVQFDNVSVQIMKVLCMDPYEIDKIKFEKK